MQTESTIQDQLHENEEISLVQVFIVIGIALGLCYLIYRALNASDTKTIEMTGKSAYSVALSASEIASKLNF